MWSIRTRAALSQICSLTGSGHRLCTICNVCKILLIEISTKMQSSISWRKLKPAAWKLHNEERDLSLSCSAIRVDPNRVTAAQRKLRPACSFHFSGISAVADCSGFCRRAVLQRLKQRSSWITSIWVGPLLCSAFLGVRWHFCEFSETNLHAKPTDGSFSYSRDHRGLCARWQRGRLL